MGLSEELEVPLGLCSYRFREDFWRNVKRRKVRGHLDQDISYSLSTPLEQSLLGRWWSRFDAFSHTSALYAALHSQLEKLADETR